MRFVDTSFFAALQMPRDQNYAAARAVWGAGKILTTNHVLGETWTLLNRRAGRVFAQEFVALARKSRRLSIHRVEEVAENEAWEWLARRDERKYSFVDATSFVVMRRLRIREALAFDGDFSAAGFIEVRP